jgi:hypothetical protein
VGPSRPQRPDPPAATSASACASTCARGRRGGGHVHVLRSGGKGSQTDGRRRGPKGGFLKKSVFKTQIYQKRTERCLGQAWREARREARGWGCRCGWGLGASGSGARASALAWRHARLPCPASACRAVCGHTRSKRLACYPPQPHLALVAVVRCEGEHGTGQRVDLLQRDLAVKGTSPES